MLLLIPIGLLLWQRRKMQRQNTNDSENGHTHRQNTNISENGHTHRQNTNLSENGHAYSQSRVLMSSGKTEQQAYMELQLQGGSLIHAYQTLQGKLENTEYDNVQLNTDNVVQDTGDYEIAATF